MNDRFMNFCHDDSKLSKLTCGILCVMLIYIIYSNVIMREHADNPSPAIMTAPAVSMGPLQANGVATPPTALPVLPGTPLGTNATVMMCQQGMDQLWGSADASCGQSDDYLYNVLMEEGNTGFRQSFGKTHH